MAASKDESMDFPPTTALQLALAEGVLEVRLNRPEKSNALNEALWHELRQVLQWADAAPEIRVLILSGAGKHFCAGIDLAMLQGVFQQVAHGDGARSREALRSLILDLQDCLSAIERCRKPVLAAIHGACLGAGLDLVCCCDMRYASGDARFAVKEIDLGMVADVGSLQRLPRLMPQGLAREMAFTGRNMGAAEAVRVGLCNACFDTPIELMAAVSSIACQIAAKSPLAIRGSKEILNYSRDHSIADGLQYVATWNAAMLLSNDLQEAIQAQQSGRAPRFGD